MGQSVSQGITTTQFFLYGKSRFTKTGWDKARKAYKDPQFLEKASLAGRVFVVTGANSGIGYAVAEYLASKGGAVYMVCRNQERGAKAVDSIKEKHANAQLHLLLGDCGLRSDVVRIADEFRQREQKLDALVCNAGALLNEKTLSNEGVEVTFATHLLFGSYFLSKLLLPALSKAKESGDKGRIVLVSSGGMYNTRFPSWEVATGQQGPYDGQLAYAFAKRGQVLLCERWAEELDDVVAVSCHPGWTDTPGVSAAYGEQKKYLQPMRSLYEGAEGIMWLCVAPSEELKSGEFYLDREPQRKHLGGPFFTDGSFTKNTRKQVDELVARLEKAAETGSVAL